MEAPRNSLDVHVERSPLGRHFDDIVSWLLRVWHPDSVQPYMCSDILRTRLDANLTFLWLPCCALDASLAPRASPRHFAPLRALAGNTPCHFVTDSSPAPGPILVRRVAQTFVYRLDLFVARFASPEADRKFASELNETDTSLLLNPYVLCTHRYA